MDISNACSVDFETLATDATLSEARGTFTENDEAKVVVLTDGDDEFEGVVTRRQMLASKHSPDELTRSVMRHPPEVGRTEDVRETARLMVESGVDTLPVFEGEQFHGVVTARDLLEHVRPHLDALDVEDVYSSEQILADPETSLGEAVHRIQEYGISHLPVVDGTDPVGMVSVSDLVDFTVRETKREQGGSVEGFDAHGGEGSADDFRAHGGHGERAGFAARLLDLPVRNVMSTPMHTTTAETSLDEAVGQMLEKTVSSLEVVSDAETPMGIVTTTDVLRALTWTDESHMPVQIVRADLMSVIEREDVARRLESIQEKYAEMDVIEATVVFQEHDETLRGLPLVRATVRLFTDEGTFAGTHEEYGAESAFDEACELLERNVIEDKRRSQPEPASEVKQERAADLVEWWIEP